MMKWSWNWQWRRLTWYIKTKQEELVHFCETDFDMDEVVLDDIEIEEDHDYADLDVDTDSDSEA